MALADRCAEGDRRVLDQVRPALAGGDFEDAVELLLGFGAGVAGALEEHGPNLSTGAGRGDRHPKIGKGVLLGAGAKVLGNITVGDYAKVASGSVVLKPVPAGCTVAGVPARLVNCPTEATPARTMDHTLADIVYDFVI